ncbi:hypothetical protein C8F01DRAFT_1226355 [Mycena amicta]|nr:hypothetical protein C8F01DRAFT_1226355 [Mycena amicta]
MQLLWWLLLCGLVPAMVLARETNGQRMARGLPPFPPRCMPTRTSTPPPGAPLHQVSTAAPSPSPSRYASRLKLSVVAHEFERRSEKQPEPVYLDLEAQATDFGSELALAGLESVDCKRYFHLEETSTASHRLSPVRGLKSTEGCL